MPRTRALDLLWLETNNKDRSQSIQENALDVSMQR